VADSCPMCEENADDAFLDGRPVLATRFRTNPQAVDLRVRMG
jgi:hypothetical protein